MEVKGEHTMSASLENMRRAHDSLAKAVIDQTKHVDKLQALLFNMERDTTKQLKSLNDKRIVMEQAIHKFEKMNPI